MKPEDARHFAQLMAVLGETFSKDVSPKLIDIYFKAFERWPIEAFEQAVNQAVMTCKFFPKPVELIELLEGTPDDQRERGELAWRQLWKALACGTYRSLFCEDRVLAETVRQVIGGWMEAGMLPRPESEQGPMYRARQKEFVAAYVSLAKRGGSFDPYLIGRTEAENSPPNLVEFGMGTAVTYLPLQGEPDAVELAVLLPDHPIAQLQAARERRALPEGDDA